MTDEREAGLLDTETAATSARGGHGETAPLANVSWRYEQVEEIGRGGMGAVYRAFDPDLERFVALKVLRDERASADNRARLLREARAMARLSHPNVLVVYEVGTAGGRDYIAMELIEGGNLAEWLNGEGPFAEPAPGSGAPSARSDRPWRERLDVLLAAGRGLHAAHEAGLIHRDFKPANVLLSRDGRVLVTDFGLARYTAQDDGEGQEPPAVASSSPPGAGSSDSLTRTGSILGTPVYMSPEQHDGGAVDARSDQFSFCVAAYEALYGARPFTGATRQQLRAAIDAGPAEPDDDALPNPVRRALWRGLRVDPGERFPDMASLLAELERALERGRSWLPLAAGLGGAAVLAALAVLALRPGSEGQRPATATDGCADVASQFGGVWNETREGRLRAAFTRFDRGAEAFRGFARAMDDYRRRWTDAYRSSCQQRTGGGEDAFHLAVGCLLGARNEVDSYLAEYETPDASMVGAAAQSARELEDPARCRDAAAMRRSRVTTIDPAKRKQVRQLRRRLAGVHALRRSARSAEAVRRVTEILARARTLGDSALISDALISLGRLHAADDRIPEARQAYGEGAQEAEITNRPAAQARALIALADLQAHYSSDFQGTRTVIRRARAALRRYGGDPIMTAELALIEANVDVRQHRYADAMTRAEVAKLAYERAGKRFGVAAAWQVMAWASSASGKPDHALGYRRKRLAFLQREASADAGSIALALESVAESLVDLGRVDEARATSARAAALWRSTATAKRWRAELDRQRSSLVAVSGVVVDNSGNPVAAAEVVGAVNGVWGNSKYLYSERGAYYDHQNQVRRARTNARGEFVLPDLSPGVIYHIAAEHDTAGRSAYQSWRVTGPRRLTLRLRRFGAIAGTVSVNGARPPSAHLHIVPPGYDYMFTNRLEVPFSAGDRFQVVRVPEGEHLVQIAEGEQGKHNVVAVKSVRVEAGKTTRVALAVNYHGPVLRIILEGETRGAISGGVVGLFAGHPRTLPADGGALIDLYSETIKTGRAEMQFATPVAGTDRFDARVSALEPGNYTVCAVGLTGDIRDPRYFEQLRKHRKRVPVRCRHIAITAGKPAVTELVRVTPVPRLDD